MINKDPILVQILVTVSLLLWTKKAHASATCNRACGSNHEGLIPYPFGFSAGCEIQLNCSADGKITVGEFPVQVLKPHSIQINMERKCNRPLRNLRQLFGNNFAPMSLNAILLENCTEPVSACEIPSILVQTRFSSLSCSNNLNISSISCYSESNTSGFIDLENLSRKKCDYLLTSICFGSSYSSFDLGDFGLSLEVQVMELAWWLDGTCNCAPNANCTLIITPKGERGYRCNCVKGYEGDGFQAGFGCRKGNPGHSAVKAAIASIVAGLGLLLVILCCLRKKLLSNTFSFFRRKHCKTHQNVEALLRNYGPLQVRRYRYSDVKKMTNSFREKLGTGGFGDVYKGKLDDGCLVAVKVLNNTKESNAEEFINEVATISRTSHVNIVSVLGFCFESAKKRALIFEFMPNGSLEKFIFEENSSESNPHQLDWETHYQISLGIAHGLEYLHRGCNTRILHFDIKPQNILLDANFVPKISDFGLAKICTRKESIVSMMGPRGTIGYIAPEVLSRNFGGVSYKSDVYSYGMMVLEMVGGRKNINVRVDNTSEIYFPHWIYRRLEIDEDLGMKRTMNEEDRVKVRKMITVSLWCIQTDPSTRPTMSRVIEMLEGSLDSLKVPPKPFLSSPPRSPPPDSSSTSGSEQI